MSYTLVYKHSVFFWVSLSMLMVFLILVLQYAWNSRIYIKVGTLMFFWCSNILCTSILKHVLQVLINFFFKFLCCSFFFLIFDIFLHMLIFAIRAFWLISDVLTFLKICGIWEKKWGRYFLISQLKDMLNWCLNLNESQPVYAYKLSFFLIGIYYSI